MNQKVKGQEDFMKKIFSTLSKEGAIEILRESKSKLISRRKTPESLGLTKRQYYSRLRELKNLNVIKKEGEGYIHTDRGKGIWTIVNQLFGFFAEGKSMPILSTEEKNNELPSFQLSDSRVKTILNYEEIIEETIEMIKGAEEELYISTKHIDYRIILECLDLDEDVNFKAIIRKHRAEDSIELMKGINNSEKFSKFIDLAKRGVGALPKVPYSFVLKDGEVCSIEVPNPLVPDSYFFSLKIIKDESVYSKLKNLFMEMFEIADSPFESGDLNKALNKDALSRLANK